MTDKVAIERKELSDLMQCLGEDRERFTRELVRAKGLDFFAVVIESNWQELAQENISHFRHIGNFPSIKRFAPIY